MRILQSIEKFVSAQREIAPRLAAIEADVQHIQVELDTIKHGTWQAPTMGAQSRPVRHIPRVAAGLPLMNGAGPFGASSHRTATKFSSGVTRAKTMN